MNRYIILLFWTVVLGAFSSSAQAPFLVKDMNPGTEDGIQWITDFECSEGLYYYIARTEDTGNELWRSDGTEAGTFLVKDINPDNANVQNVSDIFPFNGGVLFGGEDDVNGKEPWFSDGTEAGTFMLADIEPGTLNSIVVGNWAEINGKAVFTAFYEQSGQELFVTDGTTAGTGLLKELSVGAFSNSGVVGTGYGAGFFKFDGNLYFIGDDNTSGFELWKTDGTTGGTELLKDINPGSNDGMSTGFNLEQYYIFNDEMYFVAEDGTNGVEVWKTNGTAAGTVMLSDINPAGDAFTSGSGYPYFFEFNGRLYFIADDGTNGKEVWSTDGTDAGTSMLKNINPGGDGINVPGFINYQGTLIFGAEDFNSGTELWKSDGTSVGTVEVMEINPGSGDGVLTQKVNFNGFVFFIGYNDTEGAELYKTDGTSGGTVMVKDVYPGNFSGIYQNGGLHVANDLLYYIGSSPATGQEIWQTDGTETGTICAGEIEPGSVSGNPQALNLKCQHLYFTGLSSGEGNELWAINTGWVVGEEEIMKENSAILIYPNPTDNQFTVEFGKVINNGYVQLLDLNMKLIYEAPISEMSQLTITTRLSAGTYFVAISDGDSRHVQKVQIF